MLKLAKNNASQEHDGKSPWRDHRQHQRQAQHRRAQAGNDLTAPGLLDQLDAADDQQQPRDAVERRIAIG